MERDKFMNPIEAKDFGLLDVVVEHPPLPTSVNTEQS
jgi:ATP-dependent protease ClpP protease subunit